MQDLQSIAAECRQTLDALKIPYAKDAEIVIDARLKRCWGLCRKRKDGTYVIKISPILLEDTVPRDSLLDTLYHELLHTAPRAMSHGKTWRRLAQKVNQATGLNIKPTSSAAEKGIIRDYANDPSVKFLCQCENCGAEVVRYRNCALVRKTDRYRCSCGGTFTVIFRRV